jgi:hypothetical protein
MLPRTTNLSGLRIFNGQNNVRARNPRQDKHLSSNKKESLSCFLDGKRIFTSIFFTAFGKGTTNSFPEVFYL